MKILRLASRLAVLVLAATIACTKTAQPPLAVEVFTGQENGFHVNSTLISGERDAVLIDAQFTLSDGERLAEKIQASGKNLKTVFITHAHPDHYFGLEKIKARFPNAEVIAAPEVVEQMNTLGPQELAQWKPLYGDNLTGAPILPTPFGADH
ncbi:MAG: MBL fold metallo-hydrolase, partial [bacterium]